MKDEIGYESQSPTRKENENNKDDGFDDDYDSEEEDDIGGVTIKGAS